MVNHVKKESVVNEAAGVGAWGRTFQVRAVGSPEGT